ncbi:MAG: hypothetical protein M3505_00430 [Verrucomicrobiota bacterium]|nr:hypothetical protein [Verrucomicrobiota bacterium]
MSETAQHAPADWLGVLPCCVGEILIRRTEAGEFSLCHREDAQMESLRIEREAEAAAELARYDDSGRYRPLKTAPNLQHGWRLLLGRAEDARLALAYFYPGRAAAYQAWKKETLRITALRQTLARQTGMYRVAAGISDEEADALVGNFCKSDGGCLRTILWRRDAAGAVPSTLLPRVKFDPGFDQTGRGEAALPLLCQEACNLLVAEARKVVKTSE